MDLHARVTALNEQRLRAWEQGKALLAETEGRLMTSEEKETFARINLEISEIDEQVREFVATAQRENDAARTRDLLDSTFGTAGVAKRDKAENDYFRQWLSDPTSVRFGHDDEFRRGFEVDINRVAKERELMRQGATNDEIRALAWDATSGSLVVPTEMARSLFDVLEANIAAFRIGATRINTSGGENMQLPKLVTHAVATQVSGQGTTLAGTDPVLGRVNLNVFKYGQLVKVSNELVGDSAFNISSWLGQDLGYSLARVIDTDLVVGTGTGEPTGMTILAGAGTNAPVTTGGSLIAPTVEKFIDLVYSVNDGYRSNGGAWLMKDSVAGTIRKLRDGAGGTIGAFLWEPSLTNGIQGGQPDRFLGYPVYTDPNCAAAGSNATLATFGDFSQYTIRGVGNPVVDSSSEAGFTTDETFFRGRWRVGGNHRQVAALNTLVQNV